MRILLILMMLAGLAQAETYEQIDIMPELFEGQSVEMEGLMVHTDLDKWVSDFSTVFFGMKVVSGSTRFGFLEGGYLNVCCGIDLAFKLVTAYPDGQYEDVVLKGNVEKWINQYEREYYLFIVTEFAVLDGETYNDDVITWRENPVLTERARWDAGDDNKIGIAEAIQALQVVGGL